LCPSSLANARESRLSSSFEEAYPWIYVTNVQNTNNFHSVKAKVVGLRGAGGEDREKKQQLENVAIWDAKNKAHTALHDTFDPPSEA